MAVKLLPVKPMNLNPTIYAVFGTNGSGANYLLGYCTVDRYEDIATHYDDKKGYELVIKEVKPIHISADKTRKIQDLKFSKGVLARRIEQIDLELKSLGV